METAEESTDPTMDWVSYKDSFNPANLHCRDVITVGLEDVGWSSRVRSERGIRASREGLLWRM